MSPDWRDDGLAPLLNRVQTLHNSQNATDLRRFVLEESNRVEISTIAARLDAILCLGRHLKGRAWLYADRSDVIEAIMNHRVQKGRRGRTQKSSTDGKSLAKSTKYQFSIHMRQFYKWLLQTDEVPPQFRRLPFKKKDAAAARLRELTLTPLQVGKLLRGALCTRDEAIIITAIEGGFRASELAALRMDYVEERHGGRWLSLPPDEPYLKTGPRDVAVPIFAGKRFQDEWLEDHPRILEERAPFFVTLSKRSFGNRMTGKTISEAIARCAKRAGLEGVSAHVCRHQSATLKIAKGMSLEAIRLIHGWTSMDMLMTYVHAAPHFEKMMLEFHGVEDEEPELLDIIGSQRCLLCGEKMLVGDAICNACGVTSSKALLEGEKRRQEEQAVRFVAKELAMKIGWESGMEGDLAGDAGALEYLRGVYANGEGSVDSTSGFARWCLLMWSRHCA